jgi:hypothetical protein
MPPVRWQIVEISLGRDSEEWQPEPFPGSRASRWVGCTCPKHRQDWPRTLRFRTDCKIHCVERVEVE